MEELKSIDELLFAEDVEMSDVIPLNQWDLQWVPVLYYSSNRINVCNMHAAIVKSH